jgi:hypothetical protein
MAAPLCRQLIIFLPKSIEFAGRTESAKNAVGTYNSITALRRQSLSHQISADSLRKTGIFAVVAGDFRQ